jgi:hypothetical protein
MFYRKLLLIAAAGVFFAGCKKTNDYPAEPVITLKSLSSVRDNQGRDDHLVLEISFTDGDGDMGINQNEVNVPPYVDEYAGDVHVLLYIDTSGTWERWSQYDDIGWIKQITVEGNKKDIRGDIKKDPIYFPPLQTNLHIRYEVYIYDRALHKSNVITTSEMVITTGPPHP